MCEYAIQLLQYDTLWIFYIEMNIDSSLAAIDHMETLRKNRICNKVIITGPKRYCEIIMQNIWDDVLISC